LFVKFKTVRHVRNNQPASSKIIVRGRTANISFIVQ
jgi:hypothetical protein